MKRKSDCLIMIYKIGGESYILHTDPTSYWGDQRKVVNYKLKELQKLGVHRDDIIVCHTYNGTVGVSWQDEKLTYFSHGHPVNYGKPVIEATTKSLKINDVVIRKNPHGKIIFNKTGSKIICLDDTQNYVHSRYVDRTGIGFDLLKTYVKMWELWREMPARKRGDFQDYVSNA